MSPRRVSVVGWVGGGLVGLVVGLVLGAIALRGANPTWLESVGTLAAALVAAAAAVSALVIAGRDRENANRQARKDRQHAALLSVITDTAERYRDVQHLLVAFDRYAGLRWTELLTEEQDKDKFRAEAADFTGRLRASTEELPRTRQLMFSHFNLDEEQMSEWLAGYVSDFGQIGNPEAEPTEVMVIRGELLTQRDKLQSDIAAQRAELGPESQMVSDDQEAPPITGVG